MLAPWTGPQNTNPMSPSFDQNAILELIKQLQNQQGQGQLGSPPGVDWNSGYNRNGPPQTPYQQNPMSPQGPIARAPEDRWNKPIQLPFGGIFGGMRGRGRNTYRPPQPGDMVNNGWGGKMPYDPNFTGVT